MPHAKKISRHLAARHSAPMLWASRPARADAPAAPETLALKAAHLFDATGTTAQDGDTVLVVRGDHIVSVGTAAVPAGARVHRPRRRDAAAGLHRCAHASHHGVREELLPRLLQRMMRFPAEQATVRRAVRADARWRRASPPCAMSARQTSSTSGCATRINAGVAAGPRILTAVHGIGSPGGHFDDYSFPPDRVKPLGTDRGRSAADRSSAARRCATR